VNSRSNSLIIGFVIALTGGLGCPVLRAQTMSLRNRDFVESSRIIGEKRLRIMFSEVAPISCRLASSFLFTILYSIGAYVTLAYIVSRVLGVNGHHALWAQANNAHCPESGTGSCRRALHCVWSATWLF